MDQSPADDIVLDLDLLGEVIAAVGVDAMSPLLDMFAAQAPVLAAGALSELFPLEDRTDAAHSLKGMSRQMGLNRLGNASSACEAALRAGDLTAAIALPLAPLVSEALDALRSAIARHGA